MRSVITERRKKNSFFFSFFHYKIKTLINLNQRVPGPHLFSVRHRVVKASSSCRLSIHHAKEEDTLSRGILGNLAWPETRKQGTDGRGAPLLFTAHLAPLHPDTHAIYEDNCQTRHAPLKHSLMDVQ